MSFVSAIILAGGSGQRFDSEIPKQFLKLAGKPILEHTVKVFQNNSNVDEIVIVSHQHYIKEIKDILRNFPKVTRVVRGGETRKDSTYNGLCSLDKISKKVLIHDAVRPFVNDRIIDDCINALNNYSAIDVAIPSADTIIEVENDAIRSIPDRSKLMRGQTPQAFIVKDILEVHERAKKEKFENVTDDCGLFKRFSNDPIFIVQGETFNIKITYPEDMSLADNIFKMKEVEISDSFDPAKIEGKVMVIFGGTRGIGKAIEEVSSNYSKIYSFGRTNGVNVKESSKVKEALAAVYKKEGRIDFVVNSAAILHIGKLEKRPYEELINEIQVNYFGNVTVAKESIGFLKKSKGGLLLFTSSSYTRGRQNYSIYSSSKAAVVNFSQALSEELYEDGVRVNVICPERTKTPMRTENFGSEPEGSLLDPVKVALTSLSVLTSTLTGQVVSVRKGE